MPQPERLSSAATAIFIGRQTFISRRLALRQVVANPEPRHPKASHTGNPRLQPQILPSVRPRYPSLQTQVPRGFSLGSHGRKSGWALALRYALLDAAAASEIALSTLYTLSSTLCLMTLYAATSNPGKLAEFQAAASAEGVAIEALPHLNQIPEPIEDATTFHGNADLKAIAYSLAAPSLLVFADDSGLEVPAINNQPGVRSARFADDYAAEHPDEPVISAAATPLNSVISTEATPQNFVISTEAQRSGETPVFTGSRDHRNNALLLHLMQHQPNRDARFVCNLALARDGQILLRAEGYVEGQLLPAPRGADGFGYDPLFLVPSLNLTFAEIPRQQKWELSHRGNAFRALLAQLLAASL